MNGSRSPRQRAVGTCALALTGGVAVALVVLYRLATARHEPPALRYSLGGDDAVWAYLPGVIRLIVPVTVCVVVGLVVALVVTMRAGARDRRARVRRSRVLAAVAVVVGANLTTQTLKQCLTPVLDEFATMPSGHATLALSSAAALVIVTVGRWRPLVLLLSSAWATLGSLGIVAAHWHPASDVVAAWLVVLTWVLVAQVWLLAAPEPQRDARVVGQNVLGTEPPAWLTAGSGAAWVLLTLCGWGTGVPHNSWARDVVATVELVGLPLAAAALMLAAVPRASRARGSRPTH